MRPEVYNFSQLLKEQARVKAAFPRVSDTAGKLGSDEGPERYRYSNASGLDVVGLISSVGKLRSRIRSIALPALESRQQKIDELIAEYPQKLQTAEATFVEMTRNQAKFTPGELSMAEQALLNARREFTAPPIEELKPTPPVASPTPHPYKYLELPTRESAFAGIAVFPDSESLDVGQSKRVALTPQESTVLLALARARVTEQRRLKPAELAAIAFNQSASAVGLNKIMRELRKKLSLSGHPFIDSTGATKGPKVLYGIADDVSIKSEALDQEKSRAERLDKLGKAIFTRSNTRQKEIYEKLVKNFGQQVDMSSEESIKALIYNIRQKLAGLKIDGFEYKINTVKRGGKVFYSIKEVRLSTPEAASETPSAADATAAVVLVDTPPAPVAQPAPFKAPVEFTTGDPLAQIEKKDRDVAAKVDAIVAKIVASNADTFTVPLIAGLFDIPNRTIEQAIEDNRIRPSKYEGHHGILTTKQTAEFVAQYEYKFNLTIAEKKQLRKLILEKLANASKNKERSGRRKK